MPSLVTIDLETTGLDPQKDAIIEIAAVRFSGARVEAEWSTLINPGRPIPPLITQLTGITNDMVRTAPPLKAVIQDLAAFVGTSPVVGHNVRFDLGFLQKQGILGLAEAIDTYELAAVLMPTASRYNLGSLGQILGILIPNSHRALDDARLTHAVYFKLSAQAVQMPIELLAEIVRDSETLDWDAGWFFAQIMRARAKQPIGAKQVYQHDYGALFASTEAVEIAEDAARHPGQFRHRRIVRMDPYADAQLLGHRRRLPDEVSVVLPDLLFRVLAPVAQRSLEHLAGPVSLRIFFGVARPRRSASARTLALAAPYSVAHVGVRRVLDTGLRQVAQILLVFGDLCVPPRQVERDLRHVVDVAVADVPHHQPGGLRLLLEPDEILRRGALAAGGDVHPVHAELPGELQIFGRGLGGNLQ